MSTLAPNRPFLIEMDITVRTYHIDSAGHVSNIRYLYWMEDMRLEVMARYCDMQPLLERGYQPVIIATNIEYKRPIKLFDKPKGYMWIRSINKASYEFEGEIHLNGELTTHVIHTGVFVDSVTGKPKRLPPEFAQQYQEAQRQTS
jgi:acyl-CoA thioester hydrolase